MSGHGRPHVTNTPICCLHLIAPGTTCLPVNKRVGPSMWYFLRCKLFVSLVRLTPPSYTLYKSPNHQQYDPILNPSLVELQVDQQVYKSRVRILCLIRGWLESVVPTLKTTWQWCQPFLINIIHTYRGYILKFYLSISLTHSRIDHTEILI